MKVVINVGRYERQFSNELLDKPKVLLEIGGKPLLWHVMKHYAKYGYKDFILMCNYKAYAVKDGSLVEFEMTLGELTDEERQIILKGCLINYNRI